MLFELSFMNIYTCRAQVAAAKAAEEIDVRGLHPSPDKTLAIIFHVLLPTAAWNWGKNSTMHVRFGHPKLGGWKRDVGEFKKKG